MSVERDVHSDPVAAVDARDALESMLADSPERTKAVLRLSFDGYTVAEIAEVLGMTSQAVSAVLHRSRSRARETAPLEMRSSR